MPSADDPPAGRNPGDAPSWDRSGNLRPDRGVHSFEVKGSLEPLRPPDRVAEAQGEAALVQACQVGDRSAQEALYLKYRVRVHNLCARISGEQDADELSQEIFLKVFRGIARFRGDSALATWIYRLAVNAALTHVTRRPRERSLDEAGWDEPGHSPTARDPRLRERIERALADLPAGYRAVLVLHDIEGLSHEEIADVLDCRVGTSKSQLHKARQKMRALLGPAVGKEVRP